MRKGRLDHAGLVDHCVGLCLILKTADLERGECQISFLQRDHSGCKVEVGLEKGQGE